MVRDPRRKASAGIDDCSRSGCSGWSEWDFRPAHREHPRREASLDQTPSRRPRRSTRCMMILRVYRVPTPALRDRTSPTNRVRALRSPVNHYRFHPCKHHGPVTGTDSTSDETYQRNSMTWLQQLAVFGAGIAAGGINTIVGLGHVDHLSHAARVRLPTVTANLLNTLGLVPGRYRGSVGIGGNSKDSGPGWYSSAPRRCSAAPPARSCC